jgi:4-hydroxy-tetrahydrodipicolinate reductase
MWVLARRCPCCSPPSSSSAGSQPWRPTIWSAPALRSARASGSLLGRVGSRTDVEIVECHHRHKEDSPSGTALKFGQIVQQAMGQTRAAHGREGRPGARPADEIGYHAVRAGDNPGEHTILFGLDGESLSVNVRATSRDCYATGALAAAAFLVGRQPGLYSMRDVLGIA